MVLPLLFSFLAPQLLGGTALGATLGTAGLSALGAGVGGAVETGDLEKGLMTGLGAFAGGQLLGPMFGGGSNAIAEPLAGQTTVGQGANAMTALAPGNPGITDTAVSALMPPAPVAGAGALPPVKELMGGVGKYAMSPQGLATGIGSMAGSALGERMFGEDEKSESKPRYANTEMHSMPRIPVMPGADYQAGTSGEWNYGISTPQSAEDLLRYNTRGYADGGMLRRMANPNLPGMGPVRLAGGGIVALAGGGEARGPNEREVISAAIAAVRGQHPQPEIALAQFVQKFGENALRQLVDKVQSGEMSDTAERFAKGENGEVRGPGDGSGVDDMVPAKMDDGSGDVLLSDGEYVLRKDATDSLERKFGGGFLDAVNNAGSKAAEAAQRRMAAA